MAFETSEDTLGAEPTTDGATDPAPAGSDEPGRLHVSSVLFRIVPHARALVVPAVAVLFASSGSGWQRWQAWLLLLIVPSAIYEIFQYMTYRYRLTGGELLVTSGLVFKRARHIAVERIHSVDLKQGPLHRLLGVAEVRIETAGGTEPEAVLRVLRKRDVDRLRESLRAVQQRESGAHAAEARAAGTNALDGQPPAEREILSLDVAELTKLGLVSMRGAAVAAVLVGLMWEFGLFDRLDIRDRIESVTNVTPAWQIAIIAALVMLTLPLLLIFVSIGWTIVRLYGFRLVEIGGALRLTCGLLTRLTATVPRRRIQLVSIIQTPIHRYFDRVSVRIETASGSAEAEQKKIIGQRWFVPILPTDRVDEILKELMPGVTLGELDWRPLAPGAARRAIKLELVYALSIALGIMLFSRPAGLIAMPILVALLSLHAWLDIKRSAWALFDGGIAYRCGVLTRSITITRFEKVQCVSVEESPFDRRRGMATRDVDTAGAGAAGRRVRIKYLERETADRLYRALSGRAAETQLRW